MTAPTTGPARAAGTHTENTHVAAIRAACDHIHHATADAEGGTDHADDLNAIVLHADALARELADAETRAEFDRAELQAVTDAHERTKAALDAERARAETAERKVELYEWMAYQRRRNPGISDDNIMRLTYVPEWRDHAEKTP